MLLSATATPTAPETPASSPVPKAMAAAPEAASIMEPSVADRSTLPAAVTELLPFTPVMTASTESFT